VGYDSAVAAAEAKTAALDGEVDVLKTEICENESKFHLYNQQMFMLKTQVERLTGPSAEKLKSKYVPPTCPYANYSIICHQAAACLMQPFDGQPRLRFHEWFSRSALQSTSLAQYFLLIVNLLLILILKSLLNCLSCPRAATVLSCAEEQAKELKEKQRQIKDNHSTGAGSMGPTDPMHEYSKPQEFTSGTANVLAL
jgi:hypothetical protein